MTENDDIKSFYKSEEDKLEKVLENLQATKTPVVRNGKQETFGCRKEVWKAWIV